MPIPKSVQSKIVGNAMKGAFATQENELKARIHVFSAKVYRSLVTEEQEKAMRKLPQGFFQSTRLINVNFLKANDGNWSNRINYILSFEQDVPRPAFLYDNFNIDCEAAKPFIKTVEALQAEKEGIDNKRKALREKITAVVSQARSVRRLVETWPDAAGFIPPDVLAPKKQLPTVLPEGLDEMLKQAKL